MTEFATVEWIAELDTAVAASVPLSEASKDISIVVRQTVTDMPTGGDFSWHVTIDSGTCRVLSGPGTTVDVTFTQDHATAQAIAAGTLSAQAAFMLGKLRMGGNVAKLMEYASAFNALDDVFTQVRANTTY